MYNIPHVKLTKISKFLLKIIIIYWKVTYKIQNLQVSMQIYYFKLFIMYKFAHDRKTLSIFYHALSILFSIFLSFHFNFTVSFLWLSIESLMLINTLSCYIQFILVNSINIIIICWLHQWTYTNCIRIKLLVYSYIH